MNQERIGKFIAERRKFKKMTQLELAEKLGVTDKSIGNWENGRNMPDISLFKPLCEELDITINELLSGEVLKEEDYQEKFEENIINTIAYSTKKINLNNNFIGVFLIIIGVLLINLSFTTIPSDSSWGSIYSVIGSIISLIGVSRLTKKLSSIKRVIIHFLYYILVLASLFVIDYIGVVSLKQLPRFCTIKKYGENFVLCENPFYNVYKINKDTNNKYIIVDLKKIYTEDTVPIVPFNRNKSGIDNIIKYENNYLGNNSNTGNLIAALPLSEYGYVFKIDSKNLELSINYHITDWYINESAYLEKSLVYNSVSLFALIKNLNVIHYNFSGKTYTVKKEKITENFKDYEKIVNNNSINKDSFNKYLESKINDIEFINNVFKSIVEGI